MLVTFSFISSFALARSISSTLSLSDSMSLPSFVSSTHCCVAYSASLSSFGRFPFCVSSFTSSFSPSFDIIVLWFFRYSYVYKFRCLKCSLLFSDKSAIVKYKFIYAWVALPVRCPVCSELLHLIIKSAQDVFFLNI